MPFGTEAGIGPGHIVLDGDPAPPQKQPHSPLNFRPNFVAKRSPISATVEHLLYKEYTNVI